MTYVSWAALYEGATDQLYFDVLISRLMEDIVLRRATRNVSIPATPALMLKRGSNDAIARELCASQSSFHMAFIHSDTGGRNLERAIGDRGADACELAFQLCHWPTERCILIAPRHEMEAWALADPNAVCFALGYTGSPTSLGLPASAAAAERLTDPKATLLNAVNEVRGRRGRLAAEQIFPAIAQAQSLICLRRAVSFQAFEQAVAAALGSLGCFA